MNDETITVAPANDLPPEPDITPAAPAPTPEPPTFTSEILMPALSTPRAEIQNIPLSLDEFCRRLSQEDRRTVLIGGFHLKMRQAKRSKDTDAAWRAAFDQFVKS